MTVRTLRSTGLGLALLCASTTALAAAPAPYSLPWQLRPTTAGNVLRSDTSIAFSDLADGSGQVTVASLLLGSYKVSDGFAPLVRWGVVNRSGGPTGTSTVFTNPVIGGTYVFPFADHFRLAAFFGVTVPIGMGGGDAPDAGDSAAIRSGVLARSALDNAMFAINDLTVFPGLGLSYTRGGFTAQLEATVLQLTRVRGEASQADASRTNFTSGIHLGYFVLPQLSIGGELRYQRWLSTPVAVESAPATRDTLTAAAGLRLHLPVGEKQWVRPGISYARGLDDPMGAQEYSIVQVDVPFAF